MELFRKIFETIEQGAEEGFSLAASVSGQVKEWTVAEGWWCGKQETLGVKKESYCAGASGSGKHSPRKYGCSPVAIVKI